jgi:hypothetical protein
VSNDRLEEVLGAGGYACRAGPFAVQPINAAFRPVNTPGTCIPTGHTSDRRRRVSCLGDPGQMIDAVSRYVTPELLRQAALDREEHIALDHGARPKAPIYAIPSNAEHRPLLMQSIVEALARGDWYGHN